MTDPSYTALRAYHRTVNAMLDDPDVTGDLLLIGLWMARAVHLSIPEPGPGNWAWKALCADVFNDASRNGIRLKRALKEDIPRYDPLRDEQAHGRDSPPCAAPMIRRDGSCGQPATKVHMLTDVATGRGFRLSACSRHRSWLDAQILDNRQQVKAVGDALPTPAPNCGGVLRGHIPRGIGWKTLYQSLDPKWTAPAGVPPVGRPRLEVLTFEPLDNDIADAAGAERPVLSVIRGGWR